MSKRHFDEYFNKIASQYHELLEGLKEFEQLAMTEVISPDRIEAYKETLQPIKDNFMALSYVKFLLDQPERDKKERRYIDANKKLLKGLDIKRSPSGIIAENSKVLDKLKKI